MIKMRCNALCCTPLTVNQIRPYSTSRVNRGSGFWSNFFINPHPPRPAIAPERFKKAVYNPYYKHFDTTGFNKYDIERIGVKSYGSLSQRKFMSTAELLMFKEKVTNILKTKFPDSWEVRVRDIFPTIKKMELISRVDPEEALGHSCILINEIALRTLFARGIPFELEGVPQELNDVPERSSRAPVLLPGRTAPLSSPGPVQEHLDSGGPYSLFRGTTNTGCPAITAQTDSITVTYYATSRFGINVQALSQLCKDCHDVSMLLFQKEMCFYEEEAEVMVPRDIPGSNILRIYHNGTKVEQSNSRPLEQLDFDSVDADLLKELVKQRCCAPFDPSSHS
jgi:hypothetical protein